jgi:hypothetical protein
MLTFYVLGRQASAAVQGPLDEYNKLALIAAHNQRELKQAMDREQEQNGLQRLVSLPRGRTQALQMLSDVVDTFAAASRASTYRFLLTRYEWQDADTVAALAKAARPPADERRGQQRTAQPEPEAESTSPAPEQPASKLLVGEVSGVIRLPRGGSPREAYRSFLNDFVEGLRNRASLRMATATGKFTKGSTTVELAEGPWFGVVAAGDMVRPLPDGQWCLLAGVTSETELALAEPFEGKDCQVPCAFSRVSPLGFNGEALEFSVRFVVPKAPAVELFARGGPGE